MTTKDLLNRFPKNRYYYLINDEYLDKSLNLPNEIEVNITMIKGGLEIISDNFKITRQPKDDDYFAWLSVILKQYVL